MAGGRLVIPIAEPVLTNVGLVAAGSTLSIFNTGTGTLSSLFSDRALTVPIVNPLVANAAGRFYAQATVWWASDALSYDYVLDVSDGTIITGDTIYVQGGPVDLSLFAPINSPVFTGVPQAPTPASSDNSNKIATTAYVKANLAGYATTTTPGIIQIATTSEATAGTNFTDAITPRTLVAGLTGSNLAASFPQTQAVPGHIIFPGGIIMQWGQTALINNGASGTTTFGIPFTAQIFGVWTTRNVQGTSDGTDATPFGSYTLTTFVTNNGTNMPTAYRYLALGV